MYVCPVYNIKKCEIYTLLFLPVNVLRDQFSADDPIATSGISVSTVSSTGDLGN